MDVTYVTKSCTYDIKTQRKEWKGLQVQPLPYMFCHLRLIIKTERKKKQNFIFGKWLMMALEINSKGP